MKDWTTLMDGDELTLTRKVGDTGYWWVLSTTDLVSACGETEAAEISGSKRLLIMGELSLVPGKALVSEEQQAKVLESCGWEDAPDTEEVWVEMAQGYGLKVLVNFAYGATNERAVKKALKEACVDLDGEVPGSVDFILDKPINALGQTGKEHLANDMESALNRATCHEEASDKQKLTAKISDPAVRRVKQANLSSECMMVQVWGLEHCETCEYRNSSQCGGKRIRQTGKNENGLEVPVS